MIGPQSEQLGVVNIRRALDLAQEHDLDLVEIAPTAKPPVCRIMDYSKYKYDQEKKERRVKKSQHVTHLKQIRLKPNIGEGDYQVKLKQAIGFLDKKDKVKVSVIFRGREITLAQRGRELLGQIAEVTDEVAMIEQAPKFEGRTLVMVLSPK